MWQVVVANAASRESSQDMVEAQLTTMSNMTESSQQLGLASKQTYEWRLTYAFEQLSSIPFGQTRAGRTQAA